MQKTQKIEILLCEKCNEPIHRIGNLLYCENGCYEEDIRNLMSEDNIEEIGLESQFILPKNEEDDFVEVLDQNWKKLSIEQKQLLTDFFEY